MNRKKQRALVLGGGGLAASAWQTGLLAGMASVGLDLRDSDLFIGTSAGARVALHLAHGTDLRDLFDQQFKPIRNWPPPPKVDWRRLHKECAEAKAAGGSLDTVLRRYGSIALNHAARAKANLPARRETIASQLLTQQWPAKPLSVVAVNASTGERRAFDRASGVDLVDAMVATTAFFGSAPAVIDGVPYLDGGFHSSSNADLAFDFDEVIVLSLRRPPQALELVPWDETLSALRASGARDPHPARRSFQKCRHLRRHPQSGHSRADRGGSFRAREAGRSRKPFLSLRVAVLVRQVPNVCASQEMGIMTGPATFVDLVRLSRQRPGP